jgi:hypothetical protein
VTALAVALTVLVGATPAAASDAPPPASSPASVNPGTGTAPDAIAATAISVCAKVADKAGFSFADMVSTSQGPVRQIVLAIAVAMAESSCNPSAVYTNPNGCRDRGLWQIDSCAHPNVSDACAFQIQCNANAAWLISNKGTYWAPWATYQNGAWTNYLSAARGAISGFVFMLENRGAGTCLDARASDVRNGGAIIQWACNSSDSYQQWRVVVGADGYNPVLQNVGAGTCLDAKASDVGNGGAIIQWACNATGDAYQRWRVRGSGQLNTNGNANAGLENVGSNTCLDAKASDVRNGGAIIQWTCNSSDQYQWWN